MATQMRLVTIFGSARLNSDHKYCIATKKIAAKLAQMGFGIVTGGGGGIMQAANKAAQKHGAISIGVRTNIAREPEPNPFCEQIFDEPTLLLRRAKLIELSDAFVVMPGGFGTLDELFEILALQQIGHKKCKIALYGREFWDKLMSFFDSLQEFGMVDLSECGFLLSDDVDEIARYLVATELD